MKKIIHWLMLSCQRATLLIEKRTVAPLTLQEKCQLGLHKSICDACTLYDKQSRQIDEWMKKQGKEGAEIKPGSADTRALEEKILRKLTPDP